MHGRPTEWCRDEVLLLKNAASKPHVGVQMWLYCGTVSSTASQVTLLTHQAGMTRDQ